MYRHLPPSTSFSSNSLENEGTVLCQPRIVGTTILARVMVMSFVSSQPARLIVNLTFVLAGPVMFLTAQMIDISFVAIPSTASITSSASRPELYAGVSGSRLTTVRSPFFFEISMPMPVNSLVIIFSKSWTLLGQIITVYASSDDSAASENCVIKTGSGNFKVWAFISRSLSKTSMNLSLLKLVPGRFTSSNRPPRAADQAANCHCCGSSKLTSENSELYFITTASDSHLPIAFTAI